MVRKLHNILCLYWNSLTGYSTFLMTVFSFYLLPLQASTALKSEVDTAQVSSYRLVSNEDHTQFLLNALTNAKRTVMISSYDVSLDRLHNDGIGNAIQEAAGRGVKIYIYYEHRPDYPRDIYAQLRKITDCCARFTEICTHSKCIIQDRHTLAVGSYNWLSDSRSHAANASFVLSGSSLVSELIEDVWEGIRFYHSLAHENDLGIDDFLENEDAFLPRLYRLPSQDCIYTLTTPEAHSAFLKNIFQTATERIIMYSPFIRLEKLRQTITPRVLELLQGKNVQLRVITLPNPCSKAVEETEDVFKLLRTFASRYANFSFATHETSHAKTLIMDNHLICEGSFNWLSAVTDIDHTANNFELSVAMKGQQAQRILGALRVTVPSPALVRKHPTPDEQKDVPVAQATKKLNDPYRIFSGARFNKAGYCVYIINQSYLKESDGRTIKYFATEEEAMAAATAKLQTEVLK